MKDLFRKQAVKKQQNRLLGDVLLLHPFSYSLLCVFLIVFVAVSLSYLTWGQYARQETVSGYLLPDSGILKVYAPQTGIVNQLFVEEGQKVEKGQALLALRSSKVLKSGVEAKQLQINQLGEQIELIAAQLTRLKPLFEIKRLDLKQQITSTKQDIAHINQQLKIAGDRLSLQVELLDKMQNLVKQKHISQTKVIETKAQELNLLADKQSLRRMLTQRQQEIEAIKQRKKQLKFELEERKDSLKTQSSELKQQLAQLEASHHFIIRAEQSGHVSALQVKLGQLTTNNMPLLSLLPEGSELQGELLVPTQAIGFIEPGQQVLLRYSAFPYQKFGLHAGTVKNVSHNVLMPNELNEVPISLITPVYRVTVSLDSQSVNAYGRSFPLRAGIQLDADIRLAERTLFEWLLEPIFSLKGRFQ